MAQEIKKIALLTGGGDCPGLNAVIRTITKTAIQKYGWEVIGYVYGYRGLYHNNYIELTEEKVENIYYSSKDATEHEISKLNWQVVMKYAGNKKIMIEIHNL